MFGGHWEGRGLGWTRTNFLTGSLNNGTGSPSLGWGGLWPPSYRSFKVKLQTIGVYPSPLSRLSVQVWIFLVEGISRGLGVFVWVQHPPQHTRNSTGIFNNTLDNAYCIVYKIYISLIQFLKWFIAPVIFSFWLTIHNFHTGRVQIKLNTLIQ